MITAESAKVRELLRTAEYHEPRNRDLYRWLVELVYRLERAAEAAK